MAAMTQQEMKKLRDMNVLLQSFQGRIIHRHDEAYDKCVYQYGSTTYADKGTINPDLIFYPQSDGDVILALGHAKANGLAVAVRTGGHHYCGASSTSGKNIQLDLSTTYTAFNWDHEDRTVATFGISMQLGKFNSKLKKHGRFIPTGQCRYVHLGGHVQTGGYGQLVRSFGLLSDHIIKFRLITPDGKIQWVNRFVEEDKDLFFAVMGGSPGNFGIVTDVTAKVHRDEDHPKSRGFRVMYKHGYNRKVLQDLLQIMVDMEGNPSLKADYDYTITVSSERKLEYKSAKILVFAQWANLEGENQDYTSAFFDKIRDALGGPDKITDHDGVFHDDHPVSMSELCSQWIVPVAREYELPYLKRTYVTASTAERLNKPEIKWAEWATGRVDAIMSHPEKKCYLSAQFQYSGGPDSRMLLNGRGDHTCFSWRDSTFGCTLDVFYDGAAAKTFAEEWRETNDREGTGHPGGKFAEDDRRLLWGSHDLDLHAAHEHYYDNKPAGKYSRLVGIKRKVDPHGILTPNAFCVGGLPTGTGAAADAPREP